MCKVRAIQIANRQLAEDIVKDRGSILDTVVPLNHARWLELGEGEGIHELFQRHAVLKAHGHCDGEVVHHRTEPCALFVHVDKDFAKLAILIFACA